MKQLDIIDLTLILAFLLSLIAVIFSAKFGMTKDAFDIVVSVLTTTLGVFVGKKMPNIIGGG